MGQITTLSVKSLQLERYIFALDISQGMSWWLPNALGRPEKERSHVQVVRRNESIAISNLVAVTAL